MPAATPPLPGSPDHRLPPTPAAPVALFISDVHLQAEAPATAHAFLDFLAAHATGLQRLYLLGDLFEYWAGDDDLGSPFNARVVAALRAIADTGTALYWMAGNRDFLVGARFAAACRLTLLPDPSIISVAGHRIVITHGDAQCTDDLEYQEFRRQVRAPGWQAQFLSQPLAARLALIATMRDGSRAAQRNKSPAIMDVNLDAVAALFAHTDTALMIHGHTHRPAVHAAMHDGRLQTRYVLPDWDCEGAAWRGGGVLIDAAGTICTVGIEARRQG